VAGSLDHRSEDCDGYLNPAASWTISQVAKSSPASPTADTPNFGSTRHTLDPAANNSTPPPPIESADALATIESLLARSWQALQPLRGDQTPGHDQRDVSGSAGSHRLRKRPRTQDRWSCAPDRRYIRHTCREPSRSPRIIERRIFTANLISETLMSDRSANVSQKRVRFARSATKHRVSKESIRHVIAHCGSLLRSKPLHRTPTYSTPDSSVLVTTPTARQSRSSWSKARKTN